MKRLKILITTGPTREPIDPVRFISNRSTGYMGLELVKAARRRKHHVTVIAGYVESKEKYPKKTVYVKTTKDLKKALHKRLKKHDVLIMASAVADFKPVNLKRKKIKSSKRISLKLLRNIDILKSITRSERKGKLLVGFALETENLLKNARKKMKDKNLDIIVANKCARGSDPFGGGKKNIMILDRKNHKKLLKKCKKSKIASVILDTIEELCYTPN